MAAFVYETPNEKAVSGALALVMHALFLALLVFGVNWQKREQPAMIAELWSELPPLPAPKAAPPPPPPKVAPEPPPPPPKVEPKPIPQAEPKPPPKADIDLREKLEKERKAQEQAIAEKKKREAQALAEKKKREAEALAEKKKREAEALKLKQAQEAEARRLAREQEEALKKLAQQQAAAQVREIEKYKGLIRDRIKRFIIEPPSLQGNPEVELDIIVLPEGAVLDVRTRRASGQAPWDNAVERAIRRAQPLPLPPDPALMKEFRELNLKFRPKE
ncbi:MAG TPA: cell envelope integrity protein TolA [Burkholderiales bacterium]|nr:cell envelope integrity protein TolA [Burkholderiales bacterium]